VGSEQERVVLPDPPPRLPADSAATDAAARTAADAADPSASAAVLSASAADPAAQTGRSVQLR